MTNETKVLRDVTAIGDQSDDKNSGYRINQTLPGNWAVAPVNTGLFTAVDISSGQPRPVQAWYYSSARWNGSTTQITSGYRGNTGTGGGNIRNATYLNSRCRIIAVNVARY